MTDEEGEPDEGLEFFVNEKTRLDTGRDDVVQFFESEVIRSVEFNSNRQDRIIQTLYEQCAEIVGSEDSSFHFDRESGAKNVNTLVSLEEEFGRVLRNPDVNARLHLYTDGEKYDYRVKRTDDIAWASPPLKRRYLEHETYGRHIMAHLAIICMRYLGNEDKAFQTAKSAIAELRRALQRELDKAEVVRILIKRDQEKTIGYAFEKVSYLENNRNQSPSM